MKFSHQLQFNAVPEWSSKYINYELLKKLIYKLQKLKLYDKLPNDKLLDSIYIESNDSNNNNTPLLITSDPYINIFISHLDSQLYKIDSFYIYQFNSINDNLLNLKDTILSDLQNTTTLNDNISIDSTLTNNQIQLYSSISTNNQPQIFINSKLIYKKKLLEFFTILNELNDFVNLNITGFSKICKKFDKSLDTNIKSDYLSIIKKNSKIFNKKNSSTKLNLLISDTIDLYSKLLNITYNDAKDRLSSHLKEHIVWERNTVWKDMINLERRFQSTTNDTTTNDNNNMEDITTDENIPLLSDSSKNLKKKHKKKKKHLFYILKKPNSIKFIVITIIFFILLLQQPTTFNLDDNQQRNCLAILIYSSLLWATEVIPLFVTSLLIPFLIVTFPLLKNPNDPNLILTPTESSKFILSSMWSSVIMLLIGGFTLAAALSKYNIAKIISTYILSSVGTTNPNIILLTIMFIAFFISIFISNVAAPVITYSIIQPILRLLPKNSTYAKSLLLGIAFASNIGGMSSPISSPQNIFAISIMSPPPTWIDWFVISIPICLISIILIWLLLLISFNINFTTKKNNNNNINRINSLQSNSIISYDPELQPITTFNTNNSQTHQDDDDDDNEPLKLLKIHPINDPLTRKQISVIIISILTIILWCLSNKFQPYLGDIGIISILPIVTFFGTGLLTSDDFNNFMWTIVILAMGGTTLGTAVSMSGLLSTLAIQIKEKIENFKIFQIVLIFGIIILIVATFISHTVAAMIIIPLMKEIGQHLPADHSRLLIMISTLLCSSAMGLPTSGFPNVTAISMEDELGNRYLTVKTLISRGIPSSLITYLVIVTVGFGLLMLIKF